jgi:hypothetical protein
MKFIDNKISLPCKRKGLKQLREQPAPLKLSPAFPKNRTPPDPEQPLLQREPALKHGPSGWIACVRDYWSDDDYLSEKETSLGSNSSNEKTVAGKSQGELHWPRKTDDFTVLF